MSLVRSRRKSLNKDKDLQVQRLIAAEIGRDDARIILRALERAFQEARDEALKDRPEDQNHTFYSCLRRKIHRYFRTLTSSTINVRVALNGGGHENFLMFQIGNFIGTIGKVERHEPGYRKATYRKMIHETHRLIYQDNGKPFTWDDSTIVGILRWDYELSEGLPYGPSSVTVAAFQEEGETLGASVNLIDLVVGKKLSPANPTVKASPVPAVQPGLFPGLLVDPALQPTAKRRRDGQSVIPEEATKTS